MNIGLKWILGTKKKLTRNIEISDVIQNRCSSPRHMFSCEYCKVFKKNSFYRTLLVAASEFKNLVAPFESVNICLLNL